jgi:plastocyanin
LSGAAAKFDRKRPGILLACLLMRGLGGAAAIAQDATVTAQVQVVREGTARSQKNKSNVVLWLTALDKPPILRPASSASSLPPRLTQKDKKFDPHILVIPMGTAVEFPNVDPFFHNVFSLFEGKRFDLGLYEAGTSRLVHFDRAGVSYIFCNIHPEMSAVVIALKTPYFAVSDSAGRATIANVPQGRYSVEVWAEGVSVDNLKTLTREVTVSESEQSLGVFKMVEDSLPVKHKNKYGRDYDAPGTDYPPKEPK